MVTPYTVMLVGRMYNDCSREEVCGALRTIDSVTDVRADLCRGTVLVWHDDRCDPSALLGAVAKAGFAPSILVEPPAGERSPGRTESDGTTSGRPAADLPERGARSQHGRGQLGTPTDQGR
ncbi:MAG: heavy-metal-associated domain-containing protein [Phycisphaerales bacterium]|nr:heavy-metal-associated domain-containing protein [Phycisphaerales bacterium]